MKIGILAFGLFITGIVNAQTVYRNAAYNTEFTAPNGWVMSKPDTQQNSINFTVTRVGLKSINVDLYHFDRDVGQIAAEGRLFIALNYFYHSNSSKSSQAPLVYAIEDTLTNGFRFCSIAVKQIDLGTMFVMYAGGNQSYLQVLSYQTTIADFNANQDLYYENWKGLSFLNLNGPAAKLAATTKIDQSAIKQGLYNFLGQKMDPAQSEKRGELLFHKHN